MATIVSGVSRSHNLHRARMELYGKWMLVAVAASLIFFILIWMNPQERLREALYGIAGLPIGLTILLLHLVTLHRLRLSAPRHSRRPRRSVSMHLERSVGHRRWCVRSSLLVILAAAAAMLTRGNVPVVLILGGAVLAYAAGHAFLWDKHHDLAIEYGARVGGVE